jgi:hypothetical protein
VILRDGAVCVIHRPDYEDWSLPKGKLDSGETHGHAALREVHGRPKTVRWWAMTVVADDGLTPSHEVDEVRWIPVAEADRLLDYEHDRELVREARAAL